MAEKGNIRLATNIPGLKDKIYTNIKDGKDAVHWYIQFNVPLDRQTVSHKTMKITDTSGYIMRTEISYMQGKNIIVINPLDSYEQNVYYILNISKKVKSSSGKKMRTEIYIIFKLMNNQISDYKVLKSNVEVPKPRPRPKNYEQLRTRVYSFDETPFINAGQDKLPGAKLSVNLAAGVVGILVLAGYLLHSNIYILIAGGVLCVSGAAHIIYQIRRKQTRSVMLYNKGTRLFNGERYAEAELCFKKASLLDPDNEMAEYAVNKVAFYNG